ncbi:ComEC/Rec2 family competence protein [Robiginitalea sp. M366]|uniref:ComEC/Rec2 family competence protein n=1 Tax=Robiginitalea aestuariiviva TaxID=3036903 RepID=UPI00240E0A9E|nr:ComEC/Rec2 family competence protein [Robiginitalea aestuariiviva]MDG1571878.1 ComEC/Rec2 family competence protein [Robiginitalea aestuariiviva]
MNQPHTPVMGLAFGLALGISVAHITGYPANAGFPWPVLGLMLAGLGLWAGRRLGYPLFLLFAILSAAGLGFAIACRSHPPNQAGHFRHPATPASRTFTLELLAPMPGGYTSRWTAVLRQGNATPIRGRVLLEYPKESGNPIWQPGDLLVLPGTPEAFPGPSNPHSFDYAAYMASLGIWGRIRPDSAVIRHYPVRSPGWTHRLQRLRMAMLGSLDHPRLHPDTSALLKAMLLGERSALSEGLTQAYRDTGAAHMLAVSGLHVGVFTGVLALMLGPFRLFRKGRRIQVGISLALLWGYALLAGMSPSVIRAAVMFSLLALALLTGRGTQSLHFWALAAILLLWFDPGALFRPGFQMSFAAVWAILHFQPTLMAYWPWQGPAGKPIGQWTALSLSAQLGVFPVSLFYFHQFPLAFLLTNLLLAPLMGVILLGGFVLLIGLYSGVAQEWMLTAYDFLIRGFHGVLYRIGNVPGIRLTDLAWSDTAMGLGLLAVYLGGQAIRHRKATYALGAALALSGLFLRTIMEDYQARSRAEWIIPHRTGASALWVRDGKGITAYSDAPADFGAALRAYRVGERLAPAHMLSLGQAYRVGPQRLLRIDSTGVYPADGAPTDILWLSGSPRMHMERALEVLKPARVVADGSNYHSLVALWKESCSKRHIPFHHTGRDGAYIQSWPSVRSPSGVSSGVQQPGQ